MNLHGYSIDELLNGKQKSQTKNEIDNFADGQSYHDWLQSQANIKFHGWQLKIGLPIAIILLVIIVVSGIFIRRRTNPKYNPFRWEKKKEKQHSKLSKSINSNKNKKIKNKNKKISFYIWHFVKLNPKRNQKPCINKYHQNSFFVIKRIFKENKKYIIASNYDDIFYNKYEQMQGKKWLAILLSSKDIFEYHKKIRDKYFYCKQRKFTTEN